MATPSVSIITPCYNGGKYLREMLLSAVGQTHVPREIIVVDDGSTDDSAAIAEAFGPPVKVIRQQNQGESVARNVGLRNASGDYIFFLDADDLIQPQALERLLQQAVQVPAGVALMGCALFRDDPAQPYQTMLPHASHFFPAIFEGNPGNIHCWLTPRRLIEQIGGFDESNQHAEDWDFWCRIALAGATLVPVPYVGALYRIHGASQTNTSKIIQAALGRIRVVQRLCEGMLQQPELLSKHGIALHWCVFRTIQHARSCGIGWTQLQSVLTPYRSFLSTAKPPLSSLRSIKLMRWFGIPWAMDLMRWLSREPPALSTNGTSSAIGVAST